MTQQLSQKRFSINDSSNLNQKKSKKVKFNNINRQEEAVEVECSNKNSVKNNDVFKNRGSPTQLFNAIRFLKSDNHSVNVLKKMGFASLLDLKINIIPSRLGQHVVQSFDESTMSMKHWRGDIKITKESVKEILGFPCGGLKINPPERVKSDDACIKSWRRQFNKLEKDTVKVKPKSVVEKLREAKNKGQLFKINLVVLIATVLFEAMKDGTSNQRILYSISSNHDKINEMDWCGYLIDCLKKCKKEWNPNNKKSYYCGPLTFLTLFYVQNIECNFMNIDYSQPALKTWNTELLRVRESAEFSYLVVKSHCDGNLSNDTQKGEVIREVVREENNLKEDKNLEIAVKNPVDLKGKLENVDNFNVVPLQQRDGNIASVSNNLVIKDRRSVDTIKEYKKVLLKKVDDEKGFIRKTKNNLFVLENLISEMNYSLKKGLSNYPNSKEVEGLIDEWDRVINAAKRAKLNQEYSILKSSRSESVFKENEENVKKKLNLNQEQREFDSMPSFDLGFDLPSKQVAEITLCESLEKVNLTPPEEKPNINKIEVVSLLTPPEENQTIVESAEIQASTEEVNAANALFSMSKNPKDIIFQFEDSGIGVERAKFESFYYEQWIFSDIIDVWCILLNHKEFRRSNSRQSKLFCNTQVTPASMTNEDLSKDQRFENFEESVYLAACLVDEYVANLLNVDLVFFNILRDSHYYIICFNLKYHKIEIIDNRLSDTEADEGSKISEIDLISKLYGKLPFVLKNHPKFHIMRFCKPNILKMAWRTRRNESDCGIFVMRHMETYNGKKVEEWNSGFRNEGEGQKGQLKTLRRKYAAKILLSDENLHRKKIISESIEFLSLPAEDKKHRLKQITENFIKLRLQSSWNTKGKQLKKPLQSSVSFLYVIV
ncbi:ulp1 protease family, C-terminal catalytic domain-containing protein [Artemisia annua]|uniref:Ulp1 protease family, C-terminal catalytic domain-containing protein n=1 Tax=Artemisia annua TaxID=35608 RepID=A0A2U1KEQ8_ARTAN|nr:ulp1 protease family, C-terminal catalytic domain-containing protein [Artemisia annua]